MRTIKFRGYSKFYHKWVYGGVDKFKGIYRIIDNSDSYSPFHIVVENTIGQYIGRKDRNGKEVYEGDILLSSYGNAKFLVSYSDELAAFAIANVNDLKNEDLWMIWMPIKMDWWKEYTPTIIGNKFDNPELIKDYEKE